MTATRACGPISAGRNFLLDCANRLGVTRFNNEGYWVRKLHEKIKGRRLHSVFN